jgi:hypothetical protein
MPRHPTRIRCDFRRLPLCCAQDFSKLNGKTSGIEGREHVRQSRKHEHLTAHAEQRAASSVPDTTTAVKKLKQIVSVYVKSHPGINTTLVEQLMKENKYELLYIPPYELWLQPIELVWAREKALRETRTKSLGMRLS